MFSIKSRKCQEPPRTDKSQTPTNADLQSTYYSTLSTKLDTPRRTLPTIRGRRCSRRMAHSDPLQARRRPRRVGVRSVVPLFILFCFYVGYLQVILLICRCSWGTAARIPPTPADPFFASNFVIDFLMVFSWILAPFWMTFLMIVQ